LTLCPVPYQCRHLTFKMTLSLPVPIHTTPLTFGLKQCHSFDMYITVRFTLRHFLSINICNI
jgi:hypothetical protein